MIDHDNDQDSRALNPDELHRRLAITMAEWCESVINGLHHDQPTRLREFIGKLEAGTMSVGVVSQITPKFSAKCVLMDLDGNLIAELGEITGIDGRH